MHRFRIRADGIVVHEDDFREYDWDFDDYREVEVPDEIIDYLGDENACTNCSKPNPFAPVAAQSGEHAAEPEIQDHPRYVKVPRKLLHRGSHRSQCSSDAARLVCLDDAFIVTDDLGEIRYACLASEGFLLAYDLHWRAKPYTQVEIEMGAADARQWLISNVPFL